MKVQIPTLARLSLAILAAHTVATPLHAQIAVAKTALVRMERKALAKDAAVKSASIGSPTGVTALPMADLAVTDAYLDQYGGFPYVNFLVRNIGQKDADSFEVGIRYRYTLDAGDDGKWDVYPVAGLKAGESVWVSASPICCGFSPTEVVVNSAVAFEAIADPKYSKRDPTNLLGSIEVLPKIPESNKGNNRLAVNKADMRHTMLNATVKLPANPNIDKAKVAPPIIRH
jgi:hypothetical protein